MQVFCISCKKTINEMDNWCSACGSYQKNTILPKKYNFKEIMTEGFWLLFGSLCIYSGYLLFFHNLHNVLNVVVERTSYHNDFMVIGTIILFAIYTIISMILVSYGLGMTFYRIGRLIFEKK